MRFHVISQPVSGLKIFFKKNFLEKPSPLSLHSPNGSIAQLVQSICLTSRGSAVRARVLPQKPFGIPEGFLFYRMEYTVYILYSLILDKFYIGCTGDLIDERLRRHNSNHKGFTGGKGDWIVRYTETYIDKLSAMKREREIKSKKSRKYIESLLSQLD